jgi:hypothetical protein
VEEAFAEPVTDAVAVFMMVPGAASATATVKVMFPAAPAAAIGPGLVQVTTCTIAAHVQFVPVPETNVVPAGSVSVTVIVPVVAAAPVLPTAIVKTPFCPSVKFPTCDFVMLSAGSEIVVLSVVLAAGEFPPVTLTAFTCGLAAFAATFTVTVIAG